MLQRKSYRLSIHGGAILSKAFGFDITISVFDKDRYENKTYYWAIHHRFSSTSNFSSFFSVSHENQLKITK